MDKITKINKFRGRISIWIVFSHKSTKIITTENHLNSNKANPTSKTSNPPTHTSPNLNPQAFHPTHNNSTTISTMIRSKILLTAMPQSKCTTSSTNSITPSMKMIAATSKLTGPPITRPIGLARGKPLKCRKKKNP